jgi:hypothetical protein
MFKESSGKVSSANILISLPFDLLSNGFLNIENLQKLA